MITSPFAKKTIPYIIEKETLDSTNTFLKENYSVYPSWTVVRAKRQVAGRGRFTRVWSAVAGKDLTFSILLDVPLKAEPYLATTSLLVGVLLFQNFAKLGIDSLIKWPNDILVKNRKIAGILIEAITHGTQIKIIVGIGINGNSERLTDQTLQAISLSEAWGNEVNLDDLFTSIINDFTTLWEQFIQQGIAPFLPVLQKNLAWKGEEREMLLQGERVMVRIDGVTPQGTLLVTRSDTKRVEEITSGEILF